MVYVICLGVFISRLVSVGECSAVLESSPGGEASKGCRDGGAAFECALTAGLWKLGDLV